MDRSVAYLEPELKSLVSWQLVPFSIACRRGQGGSRTRFRTLRLLGGLEQAGAGRVPPRPGQVLGSLRPGCLLKIEAARGHRAPRRRAGGPLRCRPPLPSEGSRSSRPHPGPLRRGQQRSSPGCLCPRPGPQLRSHGNQAGPRCTLARPPASACVRIQASQIPAGDRSCRWTLPVAPIYLEKRVPGRAYAPQFWAGTLQGLVPRVQCNQNPLPQPCDVRGALPTQMRQVASPTQLMQVWRGGPELPGTTAERLRPLPGGSGVRGQSYRGARGPWLPPIRFPTPWVGLNRRWASAVP